jgi:hypothetical protein
MLSDERLREIMKQWSAGQQTGHHIPDLLAEIDRLKSELNGAYERAARVAGRHMPCEPTSNEYEPAELIATAIRNLKEPT